MAHWFTADTHFNHRNIIDHCNRPFADVEEMNGVLLKNFRSCVKEDDTLWIVGDFAWNRGKIDAASDIFSQLPGKKRLVRGNHDPKSVQSLLPWDSIDDLVELDLGDHHLVLSHYPLLTWNRARYGALNFFGHVHNNWAGSRNSINVGVDLWDFRPVQLQDILARAETLPVNPLWHTVEPGLITKGPRPETFDWPETKLKGLILGYPSTRHKRDLARDARLVVFREAGVTTCGLAAGSEISDRWRRDRFGGFTQRMMEFILSDDRLTDRTGAKEGTTRLTVDMIFSSPTLAACITHGYPANAGMWAIDGDGRTLHDIGFTFTPPRQGYALFVHGGRAWKITTDGIADEGPALRALPSVSA